MEEQNAGSPTQREIQWREYQMSVDLYKFYVDVVVKAILGYYAITGAILTFYFAQNTHPLARWALVLPSVLSIALAVLFRWGARLWQIVRDDAFDLAGNLRLKSAFELSVLGILLNGSALLLLLTGLGLVTLIIANL
jgi:hypothetical protein